MKSYLAKVFVLAGAAAILAVSVDAQQRVRSVKRANALETQIFGYGGNGINNTTGGTGGNTTGGTGGIINGPSPVALSPIAVQTPTRIVRR